MSFPKVTAAPPGSHTSSIYSQTAGLIGQGWQALLNSLSQHARLISIDTALEDGALVVDRFSGHEAMSGLFRFDVDCLATSAHVELKALIGQEATLRILLADGSTRSLHGVTSEAAQLGSDGSLARYRLTLVPWMHLLTLRRDSFVFQDKTVLEILEDIFQDYPGANFRFDVRTSLPKRSVAIQYRESDFDFVARLLAEEGLNFFFEHDVDQGRHRLLVFDDNAALQPCGQRAIRFHRADATEATDTITHFSERREVKPNAVALASWDYKNLLATGADESAARDGASPLLEIHEGAAAYRFSDTGESSRIARARAESLDLARHVLYGESAARQLAVGSWFSLNEHVDADGDYIVLAIEHRGANNLGDSATGSTTLPGVEHGTYRNHFTCVPRATPVRPPYRFPKPTAPGMQTALVVGIPGEEITTERDHRIKIQFPWQRGGRPAPGQLEHPATSNAPGDDTAGTWVRVAETAAGANWGASFIPRIGQEVCVDFIAGDIDRPVVIGQFYNGADLPPFHGADNHPGALTGIRSKEYVADGFNQWAVDDTPGQLRQQLASTYAASQLNIGYLIRQNGNRRGPYRGLGFELATDTWGVLRAKRGLFVSTTPRIGATTTQLDTREAHGKLKQARELAAALADTAVRHHALPPASAGGLQQLAGVIDAKESMDGGEAPRFDLPAALFDSAAALCTATPASSVIHAGQDMTMTATSSMRITAGQAVSIVAAKTTSLFAHEGGAKVIAAKEDVSVHAHTGAMDLFADQAVTVTSSNGKINIQAKQEILLASGGGYIRLAGMDIEIHCPASVSVKGVMHDFLGARVRRQASLPCRAGGKFLRRMR